MDNNLKNSLKISFIYVATILGAGFASGKELVTFFAKFGNMGILGFFISCILFGFICFCFLNIIFKDTNVSYGQFLKTNFGKKIGLILEFLNAIFLFILFSAMLAGGSDFICNIFPSLNKNIACILFSLVIFFCLLFDTSGFIKINTFICPILILGSILTGIYVFYFSEPVFKNYTSLVKSSLIYTSYNIITVGAVLFEIKSIITNKKVLIFSSLFSSIFIFLIGFINLLPLIKNFDLINNISFPIIYLIGSKNFIIKPIYSLVLIIAIFTTAISTSFAFIKWIKTKVSLNKNMLTLLICILATLASFLGFSNIIEKVYPFFGYIGLFQLIITICLSFKFNK